MRRIWPFRQFGLKVWSVIIAIMLWLVIRGARPPLEVMDSPSATEASA